MSNNHEDEDDYMSAAVLEQCGDSRPGLVNSKDRKRKHAIEENKKEKDAKNKKPTKHELEKGRLQEGLQTSLTSNNKGFALLQKMGYKPGQGIGKGGGGRVEPVPIEVKVSRGGLGRDLEVKRQQTQRFEQRVQQRVLNARQRERLQQDYRQSLSDRYDIMKVEQDVKKSQKACEQLDLSHDITNPVKAYFWPQRLIPTDVDEEGISKEVVEAEQDSEDNIEEPEPQEVLRDLTQYLRTTYHYCIWCGCNFNDAGDLSSNCPGDTSVDHDDM